MKIILGCAALVVSLYVSNSYALRCDNGKLVYEGDTTAQVYEKCGEAKSVYGDVWGDKQEWNYNNEDGSSSSVQILNNRVVNIDTNRN